MGICFLLPFSQAIKLYLTNFTFYGLIVSITICIYTNMSIYDNDYFWRSQLDVYMDIYTWEGVFVVQLDHD